MTKVDKLAELGYLNAYDGIIWFKEDKDYVCSITLPCEGRFKNMFSIYIKQKNVYNRDVLEQKDIDRLTWYLSKAQIEKLQKTFDNLKKDYEEVMGIREE